MAVVRLKEINHVKDGANANNAQTTQNQNNQMSDDPRDGGRNSFTTGRDGERTAAEVAPGAKNEKATIEEFGKAGAGIAAKE